MQEYKKQAITKEEVVKTAENMKSQGKRLVMIHGYTTKEGEVVVSYCYEDGNCICAYETMGNTSLPTISHIYDAAAAWPEREINELLGVEFEGLDTSKRLFLADSMLDEKGHIIVTSLDELRKLTAAKEE